MDQYPEVAALVKRSRIAVGHAFIGDDDRLDSACDTGTTIALIPPVSGG
jgi:molybdopterin converting factor small subunit